MNISFKIFLLRFLAITVLNTCTLVSKDSFHIFPTSYGDKSISVWGKNKRTWGKRTEFGVSHVT